MSPLHKIGNIPFGLGVLASVFPDNQSLLSKAVSLERSNSIIRLKKGMYVASPSETGVQLSKELISNHLYGPSYIGREYALRYYGLIPECVYMLTGVTIKHSRNFSNPTGNYSYQNCPLEYFRVGLRIEKSDSVCFLIASPEKALCDVINFSKCLNLRFMTDVERYLEEDIRFDTDELEKFDLSILEECAAVSRRRQSIRTLIKYIRNEQHI